MTIQDIEQAIPIISITECLLPTICCLATWCWQRERAAVLLAERKSHANCDECSSYLKRFPLHSALLRMGEFAVDTPSAAMPFLTTNPCGAQLCKRIKAGGLSSSRERCPVWDKQPRNKATQDTSGRDSGLRLSGESPLLRPRSLLPSFISHLQSSCL